MKRTALFTLALVIAVFFAGAVQAADTINVPVTATIESNSPEIDVTILRFTDGNPDNNPWTVSTEVTSMNFGTLKNMIGTDPAGQWYSDRGFCVVIYAQPYGAPYELLSTCDGLATAGPSPVSLPTGSFGLTPVYSEDDEWQWPGGSIAQGPMPTGGGASLGDAGSAVATDKLIYTSETGTGTARIIQAYYGLPPYAAGGADPHPDYEPIPLDQAPGDYEGNVIITIATK